MNKSFRRVISVAMAASVAAGMSLGSFAGVMSSEAIVTTTSTLTSPIFKVGLPKTVKLAVNPFYVGNTAETPVSQIVADNYVITNDSNVPVAVEVSLYPTLAAGVSLKDDHAEVVDSLAVKSADAFLYAKFLKNDGTTGTATAPPTLAVPADDFVEDNGIDVAADAALASPTIDPATDTWKVLTTEKSADFAFLLTAKTTTPAATDWALFTLDGTVAPNATWAAGHITVNAVFNAKALTAGGVAEYEDFGGAAEDGTNKDTEGRANLVQDLPAGADHKTYAYSLAKTEKVGTIAIKLNGINLNDDGSVGGSDFTGLALYKSATFTAANKIDPTLIPTGLLAYVVASGTTTVTIDYSKATEAQAIALFGKAGLSKTLYLYNDKTGVSTPITIAVIA